MEKENLKNYKIDEESIDKVSGGIECDEVYNVAPMCTCGKPAIIKGYYKSSQRGFVTKNFAHPLCKECALEAVNKVYTDMELKEFFYIEGISLTEEDLALD